MDQDDRLWLDAELHQHGQTIVQRLKTLQAREGNAEAGLQWGRLYAVILTELGQFGDQASWLQGMQRGMVEVDGMINGGKRQHEIESAISDIVRRYGGDADGR